MVMLVETIRKLNPPMAAACALALAHYGLLANRHREERLKVCRQLLLLVTAAAVLAGTRTNEPAAVIEPVRVRSCPQCGSVRLMTIVVPKGGAAATGPDTS